jgi:hypothetical protein
VVTDFRKMLSFWLKQLFCRKQDSMAAERNFLFMFPFNLNKCINGARRDKFCER